MVLEPELTLRIVLDRPPKGVDYGLQKGSGAQSEIVQKQRSVGDDQTFEFPVKFTASRAEAMSTFLGPYIQGPPDQQMVYIDIGTYAGQADSVWHRRLEIPLDGITYDQIEPSVVLEARFAGTGKDGKPSCSIVQPIGGWKVRR